MAKYILSKYQIKRLIEGKEVTDGMGKKYVAGENMKKLLNKIDVLDVYEKYEVVFENGSIDIREKRMCAK